MNMLFPDLNDFLELPNCQKEITNEPHVVSESLPYSINLHHVPLVKTGATCLSENAWISSEEAAENLSIEVFTESEWQSVTLTESDSPQELEAFVQLSSSSPFFPYSPKIILNSAHKGQSLRATYTGLGSVPLAAYFSHLYKLIQTLFKTASPQLVDSKTYNSGRFDGKGVATLKAVVTPASITSNTRSPEMVTFPGMDVDFGTGGNAEIGAFTSAFYWKRISLGIRYTSEWEIVINETTEAELQASLSNPVIDPTITTVAIIDVQNNGTTATAGEIEPITEESITTVFISATTSSTLPLCLFRYYGELRIADVDLSFAPFSQGTINTASVFLQNSGSSGTTQIDILRCSAALPAGESILLTPFSITATGAAILTQITTDLFNTGKIEYNSTNWFTAKILSAGVDSVNLQVSLFSE